MFFKQRAAADATLSYLFGCAGKGMAAAVAQMKQIVRFNLGLAG